MIDVNFGNKTIIAGLAMAFILAYGMVNFNTGNPGAELAFPKVEATSQVSELPAQPKPLPADQNVISSSKDAEMDVAALPVIQRDQAENTAMAEDDGEVEPRKR